MDKGKKTNITGTQLEKTVQTVLYGKGFEICTYRQWEARSSQFGQEVLLKNAPFTSIYGHRARTEFLLISNKYNLRMRIECKWQQFGGSVDEKLPYLYLNMIEAMPEREVMVIIDGDGFKPGAKQWLRDAVARGLYTTPQHHDKRLYVYSLTEFLTWANNTFTN